MARNIFETTEFVLDMWSQMSQAKHNPSKEGLERSSFSFLPGLSPCN